MSCSQLLGSALAHPSDDHIEGEEDPVQEFRYKNLDAFTLNQC